MNKHDFVAIFNILTYILIYVCTEMSLVTFIICTIANTMTMIAYAETFYRYKIKYNYEKEKPNSGWDY